MLKPFIAAAATFPVVEIATAETRFSAEGIVSSMVIDRGEQIGGPSFEVAVGAETGLGTGAVYGGLYRLTPFGDDQQAYADEFDYTIGYAWEGQGYAADVSANWLAYPGEGDEESLELFGELALDAPFNPVVMGFYDADFEDFGLEVTAGPEWEAAGLGWYAIGRAGFVEPGDGSANRTYVGAEAGAAYPLTETAEIAAFARYEIADEESFADDIDNGVVTSFRNSGFAVGVVLAAGF